MRAAGCIRLAVSHAFHSSLMEPMLPEFATVAGGMTVSGPEIDLVSNITAQLADDDFASAGYWLRHIREPVRFADSVRFLRAAGVNRFLEVGPASGLSMSVESTLPDSDPVTASVIRKDRPEVTSLLSTLAELYVSGAGVDWRIACDGGRLAELPTYAFQRRRFWLSSGGSSLRRRGSRAVPCRTCTAGCGGGPTR